jgi:hypothetical protein
VLMLRFWGVERVDVGLKYIHVSCACVVLNDILNLLCTTNICHTLFSLAKDYTRTLEYYGIGI